MSTRGMIEIRNQGDTDQGVLLYHHSDAYPDFQFGKLERFLTGAAEHIAAAGRGGWDPEVVAACLVQLSAADYENPKLLSKQLMTRANAASIADNKRLVYGGVPVYWPAAIWHGDIEYVYLVELFSTAPNGEDGRGFTIKVFRVGNRFSGGIKPYAEDITDTWRTEGDED